ncbi:MAG: hypothetical protein LBC89_04035 [Bacteroidales bacterium]|jgi:hypothetical protein|nr:hypothetical protein [Bacteroidales bacterium]
MKKILFITCLVLMLFGCKIDYKYLTIPSYVTEYFDYDDLSLRHTESDNIAIEIGGGVKNIHKWSSIDIDETYNSLCLKNNDISYDKVVWQDITDHIYHQYSVPANNIISINVYSNQAFDSEHSAGASLNDNILLLSTSPKPFIESAYMYKYDWVCNEIYDNDTNLIEFSLAKPELFLLEKEISIPPLPNSYNPEDISTYYSLNYIFNSSITYHEGNHPIAELLSNIDDFELMGLGFYSKLHFYPSVGGVTDYANTLAYLHFTKVPTLAQTHDLTITITLDDGRVFEKQITKSWE